MAPAPPGNEFSDWLAPPLPVTSLPRAPPQPGAPAQSMAGGSKSAESLLRSGGERNLRAVGKPAKCSFRLRGCSGALPHREKEEVFSSGLRLFMPISELHAVSLRGLSLALPPLARGRGGAGRCTSSLAPDPPRRSLNLGSYIFGASPGVGHFPTRIDCQRVHPDDN
ncbi:Paired Amphipathic Helix Protein Sin3A [Manis pentadactyla]|nr:Paired Amphipathic Helix Protein Sin3A [Manis pentadactyla]